MKWTDDQLRYLIENWDRLTSVQIAGMLGVSEFLVRKKARQLGLTHSPRRRGSLRVWTPEEEEQLRELAPHHSLLLIATLLGRSISSVGAKAHRLGIRASRWTPLPKSLEGRAKQVVLGSLLGDANIHMLTSAKTFYFEKGQRVDRLPYLQWTAKELDMFRPKIHLRTAFNTVTHRISTKCWLTTSAHTPVWKVMRDLFYQGARRKRLPAEAVEELDELGLAVWYMDDGTYNKRAYLCPRNGTKTENESAARILKARFGLPFDVLKGSFGYYLALKVKYVPLLFEIIRDHVHPVYRYKLGEDAHFVRVTRSFRFDAAHFLTGHGKCGRFHAHGWRLEVTLEGPVNPETGMLVDFGVLKRIVEENVIDRLDHKLINFVDLRLGTRATSESLAIWCWDQLIDKLPYLRCIRVYETPDSYAEFSGGLLSKGGK